MAVPELLWETCPWRRNACNVVGPVAVAKASVLGGQKGFAQNGGSIPPGLCFVTRRQAGTIGVCENHLIHIMSPAFLHFTKQNCRARRTFFAIIMAIALMRKYHVHTIQFLPHPLVQVLVVVVMVMAIVTSLATLIIVIVTITFMSVMVTIVIAVAMVAIAMI